MMDVELDRSLRVLHPLNLRQRGWAGWQLPDGIEVVEAVPKTSVGKFDKKLLRPRFLAERAG